MRTEISIETGKIIAELRGKGKSYREFAHNTSVKKNRR